MPKILSNPVVQSVALTLLVTALINHFAPEQVKQLVNG